MTITAIVAENDQLSLPAGTMRRLHLEPGFAVSVRLDEGGKALAEPFDQAAFEAALERHAGSMQEELARQGYASTDDFMDDVRPRD